MSARTPGAAVEAFVAPLQRAVSCVTRSVLVRQPDRPGVLPTLRLQGDLGRLRGSRPLDLAIAVELALERTSDRHWDAYLAGYRYELRHADGPMLLAFHWHPVGVSPMTWPHLHLGGALGGLDLSKAHLPTGPVPLQAVLRFAITDLGVEPLRADWRAVLSV